MANNPTLLLTPIAENGTKNAIPLNQSAPGQMSQDTGFPPETSLPLGAGGVAPTREDFNGAFYLLAGIAFMAQKGFTFNYSSDQDYYVGCVVIDPNDGKRYVCIADMTAGTTSPSNDTAGTYWKEISFADLNKIGAYNKKESFTTSGTFVAPVTGIYRITLQGGGGGGGGAGTSSTGIHCAGGGGGQGAHFVFYETLTAGTSYSYTIGAGGTGGAAGSATNGTGTDGTAGGSTTITINGHNYLGGKGWGGGSYNNDFSGKPGGNAGIDSTYIPGYDGASGSGGGTIAAGIGGGSGGSMNSGVGAYGGGGSGGVLSLGSSYTAGKNGGDGYIMFEYYDPTIA